MPLLSRACWSLRRGVNIGPRSSRSISLKPRQHPRPRAPRKHTQSLLRGGLFHHHPRFAFTQEETGSKRQSLPKIAQDSYPQHTVLSCLRWCLQVGLHLQTSVVMGNALDQRSRMHAAFLSLNCSPWRSATTLPSLSSLPWLPPSTRMFPKARTHRLVSSQCH